MMNQNYNRRKFIKNVAMGTAGLGIFPNIIANNGNYQPLATNANNSTMDANKNYQLFNMSGYQAPKINTVRVGFIGVGNRGYGNLRQMTYLEGVKISSICDIAQFRIDAAQKLLQTQKLPLAKVYTGSNDAWKEVCQNPDIDLISIAVPRGPLQAAIAIYAMQCGKHVAAEVPGISSEEEAWELVKTSESTKKHFYLMENCCYDFFELLTLNMVRQG